MTILTALGTMLVGAVVFAAVRHTMASRGNNAPLGLGVKEPAGNNERVEDDA